MNHVAVTEQEQALNSRPGLLATLRTFPRPVWILCGGCFLNKFGTFVIPFLALYMTRQGFSVTQAGLAISAYGLGHFVASILGGQLADTIGRRKTIVLSMATVAVSMLLLSQARSFGAIIVLTAITGLTGELYRPASSALLADLIPPSQRVTVYAIYRLAFNGCLVVLFELPLTGITQRFRPRPVMALGFLLIGFGFSLNAFALSIPAFVLAMSIFTLGEIISMPVSIAYVSNLAPEHLRGRYMGALSLTFSLAMMFGPAAGMAIFSMSPLTMWLSCGALGLIAAAIILRPINTETRTSLRCH